MNARGVLKRWLVRPVGRVRRAPWVMAVGVDRYGPCTCLVAAIFGIRVLADCQGSPRAIKGAVSGSSQLRV